MDVQPAGPNCILRDPLNENYIVDCIKPATEGEFDRSFLGTSGLEGSG
jgi:hypothetical protein